MTVKKFSSCTLIDSCQKCQKSIFQLLLCLLLEIRRRWKIIVRNRIRKYQIILPRTKYKTLFDTIVCCEIINNKTQLCRDNYLNTEAFLRVKFQWYLCWILSKIHRIRVKEEWMSWCPIVVQWQPEQSFRPSLRLKYLIFLSAQIKWSLISRNGWSLALNTNKLIYRRRGINSSAITIIQPSFCSTYKSID